MKIYSIKDVKIGFANPFYQPNESVAKRSFTAAIRDPRSELGKIKDDTELWYIGEWNEETGIITGGNPEYIMGGKDVSIE